MCLGNEKNMKPKYYSLKNILAENAEYNIIIGERSNGKTYACLKYALEDYIKNGNQSAYLRRWKEDITGKRAESVFNSLAENKEIEKITNGEYDNIVYYRGCYYLAKYNNETKKMNASKKYFCKNFALSDSEHDKSTSYPNIKNIIFDEFLTRKFYLPDEFIVFMNVLSTIIRDKKDVKIFMLGNTVNKYCPYFEEMGLKNIATQIQDTIDVYSYGDNSIKVAVEYCGNIQKKKESNKYFAFNNPKLNMIKNGAWELDLYPHLRQGQKINNIDIVFSFTIDFYNKKIQGDVIENDDGYFLFFHYRTSDIRKNELVYSLNYDSGKYNRKSFVYHYDRIDDKICDFFRKRKVFYQSNDIGEIVKNYLGECVSSNSII